MMPRDIEVYVDDMLVKSRDRIDHLAALERFFERIRQFRLRLNPKKCTFGVTSGKLLGYMCQRAFERIKEYLLSLPVLVPPTLDHLASLPVSDGKTIDDDFPDEDVAVVTSLFVRLAFLDRHPATNNIVEYEACILGLETSLELRIRQMEVFGDSNMIDDLRYTHLPRAQNQFSDALATLAFMIDIPTKATVCRLLIELRFVPTYCCLIDEAEFDDGLPWYHDIYQFLRSADEMLLLCLDRASADRVMREVHARVCGPHMRGHMLARKIMRIGYFWLTMETDCCQFVQRCP
ncbi:hypothetical protein CK203_093758 [Vitis vinifera]|uniref:Reverse transcriptase domain-containing protein n=1 Tax=Vitis vinifera TaxID=29760 RepID=A0A438DAT3_VITVI|nr:hypothetical protein CK203_093758 [Vitis vinifera]